MKGGKNMIYFDQAATSIPMLPAAIDEMVHTMKYIGANPGRGTHAMGIEANDVVLRTRSKACEVFGVQHVDQCLFFSSATVSLNQAILGYPWEEGDHVITSTMEHNAVRRPLEEAKQRNNIHITYIDWTGNAEEFNDQVKQHITPHTKMIALTHASNVTGDILPVEEICKSVSKTKKITTVVDASQTVGHISIDMTKSNIDMLAFPGHKGLRGPKGIGMLLVNKEIKLNPIHFGGSGGQALSTSPPAQWPQRFETGTMNVPAIAGLYASLCNMERHMQENVSRETKFVKDIVLALEKIENVVVYGPSVHAQRVPVVAFNIKEVDSEEVALILDAHYDIAVRAGLHCNALGHETLHTTDQGVIRVSINATNTEEEVQTFIQAVQEIAVSYKQLD